MNSKLRVFLVDDHAIVREGLKSVINAQPDMEVIGEAADGGAAVAEAPRLRPDVVVIDVSMPRMTGAEATAALRRGRPELKVLALTVHQDTSYLRALLEAGAAGYVLKRAAAEELVHAIRTVAGGGNYIDPMLAGKVIRSFVRADRRAGVSSQPEVALSEREEQVLRLLAQGYSSKEIAARLEVGVKSIESYKARASLKLGFSGRADIINYAIQKGWLQER